MRMLTERPWSTESLTAPGRICFGASDQKFSSRSCADKSPRRAGLPLSLHFKASSLEKILLKPL
jgi:hypothetical protein